MTSTPESPRRTHRFSRRTVVTLVTGSAVALIGAGAALAVPALAAPSAATPSPISTPVGGTVSSAEITAPVGPLLSTASTPVKCTAGPSGVLTFAANSGNAIGRMTATGDTVCTANPTDAAHLVTTTPSDANAGTSLAWNPAADVAIYGTQADASGCLMIYGGDAAVVDGLARGEVTGSYRITATSDTWVEFAGACQLHDGTGAS